MKTICDVEEIVNVTLEDLLHNDFEGFLDMIADKAGHELLQDINYEVVGTEGQSIRVKVTGFVEVEEDDDVEEDHPAGTPPAQ